MTEIIFGKNLLDVYFDFIVPPVNMEGGGILDLYWDQPPGGDVLASLLGSRHVVHLYIQSMVTTSWFQLNFLLLWKPLLELFHNSYSSTDIVTSAILSDLSPSFSFSAISLLLTKPAIKLVVWG